MMLCQTLTSILRIENKIQRNESKKGFQKKLQSKLCNSDIAPSLRNLLLLPISFCFSLFTSPNFFPISLNIHSQTSYPYSIFTIYFPSNSPLLKSYSSTVSIFSCFLTSVFILYSNSTTTFFVFFKSFFLFQLSFSTINPFYHTKYFTTPLTFLLFKIFSTSHSSTPLTSTSFTSSFFCSPTCFLYHTTQLTFYTRQILIELGSHNLTILVDIISSIVYEPIYRSTNFFASCSLNIKSFVSNITLSSNFYIFTFFLLLSTYLFISSCTLFKAAPTSSYTLFILFANSVTFSIFSFLFRSTSILSSLPQFTINRNTLVVECALLLITNSANTSHSGQFFC